jgi:3-deoxy-7-phosphoheptulonate synthase
VVKVGRIAGQFAKPRSSNTEKQGDIELPSYRGDIINGIEFDEGRARTGPGTPDHGLPAVGGNAEPAACVCHGRLCQPRARAPLDAWFPERLSLQSERYQHLADRITETMDFMRACGINPDTTPQLKSTEFYTSHEALLLGYEEALTRIDSTSGEWYATSGHMLWIGDRTRQPTMPTWSSAVVCKNPIGLKCGPSLEADELIRLIDMLNPDNEAGRLTLIARFGAGKVGDHLPKPDPQGGS